MQFLWALTLAMGVCGLERPDVEFKIFQFPPDKIPRIDGETDDWKMVPESYTIGTDQLRQTVDVEHLDTKLNPADLDVKVKVGWVKGQNHLYFLYEAYDDYWDFERPNAGNDTFEIVVDGDCSGGPLIFGMHPDKRLRERLSTYLEFQGVHAQNYHIWTPAEGKDWTMVWGCQPWAKDLPYANAAYKYNFKHGQSGKLVLEFFITPFDYAPADPARAIPSKLVENKIIGLSWSVLDFDNRPGGGYDGFWNLSHKTTMYGDASDLVAFRLMPLEPNLKKPLTCDWDVQVTDSKERAVAFHDLSEGEITSWRWDFGDGKSSNERSPNHQYEKPGQYSVTLYVEGPKGKARRTKVQYLILP